MTEGCRRCGSPASAARASAETLASLTPLEQNEWGQERAVHDRSSLFRHRTNTGLRCAAVGGSRLRAQGVVPGGEGERHKHLRPRLHRTPASVIAVIAAEERAAAARTAEQSNSRQCGF